MFISQAVAQTLDKSEQMPLPSELKAFIQIGLIFVVLYFFFIRPQQKKIKEHEIKLQGIVKGSQVIVGGIIGKVVSIKDEEELEVELATGVVVRVLRSYISQVLTSQEIIEKKK